MARRLDKLRRSIGKRFGWVTGTAAPAEPRQGDIDLKRILELYESTAATCHRLETRLDAREGRPGDPAQDRTPPAPATAFDAVVQERDALLNERDRLLKLVQQLGRDRPLGRPALSPSLPFPRQVLAAAAPPRVAIVDVGAQMLESEDHVYRPLVAAGAAHVTGFEPLEDAADLRARQEGGVRMLNYVIGRGGPGRFHVNRFDPTSSLREANLEFLSRFDSLSEMCATVSTRDVVVTRLDDVAELDGCDYLKIDVQGCTLDVLAGAERTLSETVAVHCEVEFAEVYRGEALFGDVDAFLRARGFELMDIVSSGYATTRSLPRPLAQSRLLWADAVYLRAPAAFAGLTAEKHLRAAFIAHVNYGMYDVAGSILAEHDRAFGAALAEVYGRSLAAPGRPDGARR